MPINFDTIKTTRGRKYDTANIAKIDSALAYLPIQQRASIIGSIVEESGGDPHAKNETGAYQGLLQWGADRYQIQSDDPNVELDNQIQYIKETLNDTTDHKSWTDGGKGSGYNSFRDTYGAFTNPASNLEDCFRAFSFGYVRPQGKQDSFENRLKVVRQVYDRMKGDYVPILTGHTEQPDATRVARPVLPVHRKGEGGTLDSSRQWDSLSLSEKSDIMREMVANGVTNLREIRQVYNEYAEGGDMDDPEGTITENPESVEAAKSKYPFLNKLDFSVYSDPNYKASDHGYGDIEVFHKGMQKIRYTPEYSYPNPNVNQDNVLYNPNRIPGKYAQDAINLDAISHIGHNDPTYDSLNAIIGNEYPDAAIGAMVPFYKDMTGKDLMKLPYDKRPAISEWVPQVLEAWDDAPHIYQNAIDGLVREYVISREHPDPKDPIYKGLNYAQYDPQWDAENNSPFYLGQMYDYITTGRRPTNILPEVTVNGKKANGGHLHTFKGGGYMPSASIRRDIANWEGASMETNRSFEEEARDFNRVIPKGIRDSLTSNQLDALYSYGYNVGMGNLKKRVLPTLQAYTQGKASSQDVASSMWASRDSELRGLRRRRAWERNMFTGGRDDRHVTLESMDAPSWQDNPLFFPPNPTDYGVPMDLSSPERPVEKDYSLKDDDNGMDILSLMKSMEMLGTPQQPLATYTPQRDNSMFVISAPSSNNTMLDASWFKEGGYLYDEGGVTRVSGETAFHVPSEYYDDFINGDYTVQIPEVIVSAKAPKHTGISNLVGDYLTTSNDATWFDNNRPQNPHLNDRGLRGAKMHAAWEKDNPNLAAWSMAAGAAPFAVAAYPFMAGLGEAAAGTTIGQGLTNMLNMASTTARNSTLLPWVDAGTTSYFGTQGINDISNGTFTPETAMEIAPLAQMFKPLTYSVKNATDNFERRAMEIGMRTTPIYNPLPEMKDGAISMLKGQNGGKRRMAHVVNYLFTGHKVGPKGYYNSLAPFTSYNEADLISNPSFVQRWDSFRHPIGSSRAYSGFLNSAGGTPEMWERNDLIDAYLYNKPIDPSFGMKRVATGSDFGAHEKYIAQNYPQKAKDIPVYQTTSLNQYPDKDVMTNGIWKSADDGLFRTGNGTDYVNAAGHIYTTGEVPNGTHLVKQQDLWKFNQDYVDKWLKGVREKSGKKPFTPLELLAFRYALKEMNRLGTPIITRTEWMPKYSAIMSTK